jgi:hypothetical protein
MTSNHGRGEVTAGTRAEKNQPIIEAEAQRSQEHQRQLYDQLESIERAVARSRKSSVQSSLPTLRLVTSSPAKPRPNLISDLLT